MFGKTYPKQLRIRILGTTEQMFAENAINLPLTVAIFRKFFVGLLRERSTEFTLIRGGERLLRHLHQHNIPIALATGSSREIGEPKLTSPAVLFSLFQRNVYSSIDQATGKSCFVFEDAPNGVQQMLR